MIKPKPLKPGDNIAVLSPSTGLPSVFPHIYESGIRNLNALGFNVVEFPTARMDIDEVFNNPKLRAQDLNRAFSDSNIHGIIATIGGNDSARVLKYLDPDMIKANPKLFMGFSDFTAVSAFVNQLGLVTFNGPSIMAGFSQLHNLPAVYQRYLKSFLFEPWHNFTFPTFESYSDGYPDWAIASNVGLLHASKSNDGPRLLQSAGSQQKSVTGQLFGGCIEVLEMLKGTPYWPAPDFWQGKILFFETSEEKPSIDYVKYWLRNYGVMGVFEQISGLLFGRARDYSNEEKAKLDDVILSVIKGEFGCNNLTVVSNLDFGHTDPQLIIPQGVTAEIDSQTKQIRLLESPFDLG
ncbi:LD-carboxypeptidase [Pseudoalteromonas luteoviolacea]|uniref:S66 family peptidase n=1 Tax=Pseudoalteromonas luteoviolacea TaxID=43657 RepID=UPI001B362AD0|nr:S66 peptidase family protein [Pseudoalteromonas luteoviolacea]MBQ4811323.1 LD-carboxypeptidase [Pseudoalteromonas luteoviolacea]